MALCPLTQGYQLVCRDNIAGIQAVYITPWNGPTLTYTLNTDNSIGTFSAGTASAYTFNLENESSSYKQVPTPNNINGTVFYEQTLEITLQKLTQPLVNIIKTLHQGYWRVFLLDQRGFYWLMGQQNPVRTSAGTADLGKAFGDLHGATLTFLGKEPAPAVMVSSTAMNTIITNSFYSDTTTPSNP